MSRSPGRSPTYLREVKPNIFFGVPRVFEKIYAGVTAALAADPEKAKQFDDAIEAAGPIVEARTWGRATDEQNATYDFLDEAAFAGVRSLIGLDDCDLAITGAAPLPAEILTWFRAIGVPMTEVYGMSESSGPMTLNCWQPKPGTVGTAIPGCEVKLADDGEIICKGGNVFLGYYKEPEKTAEALDEDGWLHSGDIGVVDDDGLLPHRRSQEGAHHHGRRQEHQPRQPRSRAQDDPARRAGLRHRRSATVRQRVADARCGVRSGVGEEHRDRVQDAGRPRRSIRRSSTRCIVASVR